MRTYDCVGLGIIVLDHLITVENYPVSNSKNIITSHKRQGGGPVPTALAVLGALGKSTSLIAKLDQDYQAEFLIDELRQFNVNSDFVVQDKRVKTPEAFVIIDQQNGDRTVLLNRRKEADLTPADVPIDVIQNSSILHLDGQETEAAIFAARAAREHNVLVSIDIGSDRFIPKELLKYVDMAIVSESFAEAQLVKNNPLKSAEKLLCLGPKIAGVTCGDRGSYFASHSESFYQNAFPVDVVDSTGAGDVFHGAALFGILHDFSLKNTAQFAAAAAALSCTKVGGKTGIAALEENARFLQKNNINIDFLRRFK